MESCSYPEQSLFLSLLSLHIMTPKKLFLTFCAILISLSLRDIHCILIYKHRILAEHIIS